MVEGNVAGIKKPALAGWFVGVNAQESNLVPTRRGGEAGSHRRTQSYCPIIFEVIPVQMAMQRPTTIVPISAIDPWSASFRTRLPNRRSSRNSSTDAGLLMSMPSIANTFLTATTFFFCLSIADFLQTPSFFHLIHLVLLCNIHLVFFYLFILFYKLCHIVFFVTMLIPFSKYFSSFRFLDTKFFSVCTHIIQLIFISKRTFFLEF